MSVKRKGPLPTFADFALQELTVIEAAADIPNRALFKPTEVCEIAQLQSYVLRSWEAEFPDLGIVRSGAGGRWYRRADVERVLQIKHLLFVEGLTLAGIRRRMEDAVASVAENVPINELLGRNARERLAAVREGLRNILELLSGDGAGVAKPEFRLTTLAAVSSRRPARSNGKREAVQRRRGVSARSRKASAHRKRH